MSLLIKDTTRQQREQIIRQSMDCGGGCENCSSCWLGGGNPFDMYQDYIDGKKEIAEINAEYNARYVHGRQNVKNPRSVYFAGGESDSRACTDMDIHDNRIYSIGWRMPREPK